jgi:hypothetical protein
MARQSGTSTPIFDELVREMAEGSPADQPISAAGRTGQSPTTPVQPAPIPRRRHRAE